MRTILDHLGKLTALLLTLAAGLSWWFAPEPAQPPKPKQDTSHMAPAIASGHGGKSAATSIAAIGAANLWGTVQPVATESLIEPEWRISGVAVNGQEKLVLITIEGQPVQTLKVRDRLPGGATILRIDDDHLCLLINGKKRKLDLF